MIERWVPGRSAATRSQREGGVVLDDPDVPDPLREPAGRDEENAQRYRDFLPRGERDRLEGTPSGVLRRE